MSVLEEVLLEEYDRSMRVINAIKAEQKTLPKGSVQEKLIGGRKYLYLQYRDGNKIRSDYIRKADADIIRKGIKKRKENDISLKELEKSIAQIEKALGKDVINEHTAEAVH
ncbi:MAG: hypothetical protein Q4E54_06005 [Lachnospiraceae bacterium]|nr:hypothetical protein [Lachnospiraceae bacterium]